MTSLRNALQPSRKGWTIWDNTRGAHSDFHTVIVDKNVRFPPIKARPASVPAGQPIPPLHSPISPLSPSSPLYPDGIMAPIWIRKHREMIPSVFILVLRLHETHHQDPHVQLQQEFAKLQEEEERHQDGELVREILERKRLTSERGIKLAVVLLCSRRLLDDSTSTLDHRLSLIRRQSGLDSRASLFVISPVQPEEVQHFVQSLKGELFAAALDFYREHGRRVRRKRARQGSVVKSGLSDKGWNVRYDYKLAFFSEMRGEIEVALKHYEDCYHTLTDMFSNNALLPPRTKRWAEAKVLADCLTVKIAKMVLYLNKPSLAVAQLNRHITTFRELSNTWGIGDKTFEFWSWQSKQYRLFGDLVAIAIRNGFRLPISRPTLPPVSLRAQLQQQQQQFAGSPSSPSTVSSLVPSNVLQHPGHYFFLAATSTVERRERYKSVLIAYEQARDAAATANELVTESGKKRPPLGMGPALSHETKVDHAEIIIELYTKAYEFFKAHKTKNMTFYVAAQIALTHFEAGNHEMALKFNERIAKNYRKDRWSGVLDSILQLSLESAMKIEDWGSAIRCCLELMAPGSQITIEERTRYSKLALELMQEHAPESPEKSEIKVDASNTAPLFNCHIVFWKASVHVGEAVPFQLLLEAPSASRTSAYIFSELVVHFTGNGIEPFVISHSDEGVDASDMSPVEHIRLLRQDGGSGANQPRLDADLCWRDESTKVFEGVIEPTDSGDLSISHVILKTQIGEWDLSFTIPPQPNESRSASWYLSSTQSLILSQSQAETCSVLTRKLKLDFQVKHESPAYVGEIYPLQMSFINKDDVEIDVYLDILLQPGEDESPNRIIVDDQASISFIKGVALGTIAPGESLSKIAFVECVGAAGDRLLDVSIRAIASSSSNGVEHDLEGPSRANDFLDVLQSVVVAAVDPIQAKFQAHFHQRRIPLKALIDFSPPDQWDAALDATVVGTLHAAGPWDIQVIELRLVSEHVDGIRIVHSSLTGSLTQGGGLHWQATDLFNCLFQLEVAPTHDADRSLAAFIEVYWRRHGTNDQPIQTTMSLPKLEPIPLEPTVTLSLPSTILLHEPTRLQYKFSNPTTRVTTLSINIEGAEPGTFTFAGARKLPSFVLAPDEERLVEMTVIPLVVGVCALPKMRVFHHQKISLGTDETTTTLKKEGSNGFAEGNLNGTKLVSGLNQPKEPTRRIKELRVFAETDVYEVKDAAQVLMEEDLRVARGGDRVEDVNDSNNPDSSPPFVVMVLPR